MLAQERCAFRWAHRRIRKAYRRAHYLDRSVAGILDLVDQAGFHRLTRADGFNRLTHRSGWDTCLPEPVYPVGAGFGDQDQIDGLRKFFNVIEPAPVAAKPGIVAQTLRLHRFAHPGEEPVIAGAYHDYTV